MTEFRMFDFDMMHCFFNIKVVQTYVGIVISQRRYVSEILDEFQMKICNIVNIPLGFGVKLYKDIGKKRRSCYFL